MFYNCPSSLLAIVLILLEGHSWKRSNFEGENMEIRGVEFFQNGFDGSSLIISRPFSEFEGLQKGWDLSSLIKNN